MPRVRCRHPSPSLRDFRPPGEFLTAHIRSARPLDLRAVAATGGALALALDPWCALLPLAIDTGLVFSGVTGTCTMGLPLARLPYNRPDTSAAGRPRPA